MKINMITFFEVVGVFTCAICVFIVGGVVLSWAVKMWSSSYKAGVAFYEFLVWRENNKQK